jgi:hypothetical protein
VTGFVFLDLLESYAEELGEPILSETHFATPLAELLSNEAICVSWLPGIVASMFD